MTDAERTLPAGWRWVRLRDLLTSLETGGRPKGGAVGVTTGVPSLSAEHINRYGKFDFSSLRFVPRDFYEQMSKGHIERGDILMVKDGATTGKVALTDEHFPFEQAAVNEHVFLCRPNTTLVLPRFLFLWLWSPDGQSFIRQSYQGAAIGGINQGFVTTVIVPLPLLSEQHRIVNTLNERMAAIDRARAAAEEKLKAVEALPVARLRAVFDNPDAHRWSRKRLGEVCDLLPAKSITTMGDADVLAITTACLTETGFQPWGVKLAKMWARDAAECVVSSGEILVARSNTPDLVGRVAMFQGEPQGAVASDLTIRIRPKDGIDAPFLAMYLSSLYLSGYWKERAGGASGSMKKITRSQIQSLKIPVPPLTEQQHIATMLTEQMAAAQQARKAAAAELDAINHMPAALLRQAFNGEL